MTTFSNRLYLLMLLLGPAATLGAETLGLESGGLDLRLLQEDIPSSQPAPTSPRLGDQRPNLGAQPMTGSSRVEDGRSRGGFRTDLPYGAGYEARQGQGRNERQNQGGQQRGVGQGGGRGMGSGRGR
jgi:hypothetical protein